MNPNIHPTLQLPGELTLLILQSSLEISRHMHKAFVADRRRRGGKVGRTLRPGRQTPLWNELRTQLRPHLKKYGAQANLGRVLGLPRQRINAFVTGCGQMPDAERTLQLLAWLIAVRQGRPPS